MTSAADTPGERISPSAGGNDIDRFTVLEPLGKGGKGRKGGKGGMSLVLSAYHAPRPQGGHLDMK